MAYIKVEGIQKRLKQAAKDNEILYIHGSVGMGKTAAVQYYLRRKPHLYFEAENGYYDPEQMVDISEAEEETIVFDDISQISDITTEEYIISSLEAQDKQFIFIGRGRVPKWLEKESVVRSFQLVGNKELEMSDEEIIDLFKDKGIQLSTDSDELMNVLDYSDRNTLMMIYISNFLLPNTFLTEQVVNMAEQGMFQYMDHVFFDRMTREMQDSLLSLCQFDSFSVELAEILLANRRVMAQFDSMNQIGDFLVNIDKDNYAIEDIYRRYLRWKQNIFFTKRQINENYERAALYYEMEDDLIKALECYSQTKNYDKLTGMLYKIADANPQMENFREYGKYFESIPLDTINSMPVLMSSMSVMRSLMMDPEGSEMWYQRIEDFVARSRKGTTDYNEGVAKLKILDLILPHRSVLELPDYLEGISEISKGSPNQTEDITIVDNAPSAIYGGKDLSDLIVDNTNQIDTLINENAENINVFGNKATGFIEAANLEWKFEHNEIDSYEMNAELNKLYMQADSVGSLQMCYVMTGLMVRDYLAHGKIASAEMFFKSFMEKIDAATNVEQALKDSVETFNVRMELYKGNPNEASEWLETTPNSTVFFTIQDRFIYINKVRVLIILKMYEEAHSLIERLSIAFNRYNRPYYEIQNQTLKAILMFREDDPRWRDVLIGALKLGEKYGYMRVFSDEGTALKALLDKVEAPEVNKDYYGKIKELTNEMAINYPNYMKTVEMIEDPLTDMERKVTKMMCAELTSDEICDMLSISYSGLKFHKQNIYKKLGVSSRQEAQRKAKSLGLDLQ